MGWELGSWAHGAGIRSGQENIGLGECGSFGARIGVCAVFFFLASCLEEAVSVALAPQLLIGRKR